MADNGENVKLESEGAPETATQGLAQEQVIQEESEGGFKTPTERKEPKKRLAAAKAGGSKESGKESGKEVVDGRASGSNREKEKEEDEESIISSLGEAKPKNLEQRLETEYRAEEAPEEARNLDQKGDMGQQVRDEVDKWKKEIEKNLKKEKEEFLKVTRHLTERNRELEARVWGESDREKDRLTEEIRP